MNDGWDRRRQPQSSSTAKKEWSGVKKKKCSPGKGATHKV
jgi:hypothetical protein